MLVKIALVTALIGMLLTAWATGWLNVLHDPAQMKALILASGPWGYLVFLLSFVLIQPLGVPGFPWVIGAALVWPLATAVVLSLVGSLGASIVGFGFARYLARDWVATHLPARFHRFDDRLGERSLQTVILIYLVFFLAPPVPWLLGLSKVRFLPFVMGATLGIIPGIVALTFLGGTLVDWVAAQPFRLWLVFAAVGAVLLLVVYRRRRKRTSSDEQKASPRSSD